MTIEEAKELKYREIIHLKEGNKCLNWRINGKIKLWKRNPNRILIPIKHGLYSFGYLTENNISFFHKESECNE